MMAFREVVNRTLDGSITPSSDYNLKLLVPTSRRFADEYDIVYDPKNPVLRDDNLADRVWNTGVALLFFGGRRLLSLHRTEDPLYARRGRSRLSPRSKRDQVRLPARVTAWRSAPSLR